MKRLCHYISEYMGQLMLAAALLALSVGMTGVSTLLAPLLSKGTTGQALLCPDGRGQL